MNIWRVVHRELRSAWRSMRYDLRRPAGSGRRAAEPAGDRAATSAPTAKLPPVGTDEQHPAYDAYARRTRRVRTAVVVATLAVGGAAVTYFGVVGGLAALLAGETGPPGALPGVSAEVAPGAQRAGALGGGRAARPVAEAPSTRPPTPVVSESGTPESSRPIRTVRPPRRTTPRPPVPTPAPHPTPTCSETPVPSPSASPDPIPSGEPSPPPVPPE